jgi:hypothetical protein
VGKVVVILDGTSKGKALKLTDPSTSSRKPGRLSLHVDIGGFDSMGERNTLENPDVIQSRFRKDLGPTSWRLRPRMALAINADNFSEQ